MPTGKLSNNYQYRNKIATISRGSSTVSANVLELDEFCGLLVVNSLGSFSSDSFVSVGISNINIRKIRSLCLCYILLIFNISITFKQLFIVQVETTNLALVYNIMPGLDVNFVHA